MRNKTSKGDLLECQYSSRFHLSGVPILIWPTILRSRGAGQLDLSRLRNGQIDVIEVKSSEILSKKQLNRLRKSCFLLGEWLQRPVKFKLVVSNICQRERPFLSY